MKQQDVLSILFTFVIGFLAGGYLYVAHFSKVVAPDDVPTQAQADTFVIESESYGGCDKAGCPSFQVLGDGSYRYQFAETVGAEKTIKSGTLPLEVQQVVKQVLETQQLVAQSQPIKPTDCNSYSDGIDVRYNITIDGAQYKLDSCGTAVDGESDMWSGLAQIWKYFQTVQ
jgi:hypothetical protein